MCNEEKSIAYVLGNLNQAERECIDRERLFNRDLDWEIERLELIMVSLGVDVTPVRASEEVWARFASRAQVERQELAGKTVENCADGAWQAYGPGIEFKALWSPKAMLIRCAPGASESAHRQDDEDDEHIIILAGDLEIGGRRFGTGDYVCVAAGATHAPMNTAGGCMLFTEYGPRRRQPLLLS